ncbi:NfrA family protein [Alteromonas halophila]|uniref:Bacteriophage N4 adsorption protein A C-terminal domain-containing protein n=1 Tax=Alteromonas halophila TaxID=516698 RepID=A0A918JNU2_9ALTE|nr:tetratricopeptide repeat protein [Alteromonas halophila]GGW91941.1 hypothetical protein GCM10007391_27740 [Alteromonas halophila]
MRVISTFWVIASFSSLLMTSNIASAQEPLSDYQRFVSYPYIEKAYRLQEQGKYTEALTEAKKALEHAPEYNPYRELVLQLTLQSMDLDAALTMLAGDDNNADMLAQWEEFVLTLDDAERQMALSQRLLGSPGFTIAHKRDFKQKLINRLIGIKAFDRATAFFEMSRDAEVLSEEMVERIMFAYIATDEHQKAIDHFIEYQSLSTDAMEAGFIQSVLRYSKESDKFAIFTRLSNRSAASKGVEAWVQQQIASENTERALQGFRWLIDNDALNSLSLSQYALLLAQNNDPQALALLARSELGCRAQTEIQLKFEARREAAATLYQCLLDGQSFVGWEAYASQLLSATQLKALLSSELAEKKSLQATLQSLVLQKDIVGKDYQSLINTLPADSSDPDILATLFISYEALQQWQKASDVAAKLYRIKPTAQNLDRLSFALVQSKETNKAKNMLTQAFIREQALTDGALQRLLGLLSADDVKANSALAQRLANWQGTGRLNSAVAELLRVAGNCDAAIERLESASEKGYSALMTLAMCKESLGQFKQASAYFMQAHQQQPSKQTRDALINLAIKQNNTEQAMELLEAAPADQKGRLWQQQLAQLYYQSERYNDAIRLLSQQAEAPAGLSGDMYDVYIESLIATDNVEQALGVAQQQFESQSFFSPAQWRRQANMNLALGRKPEAIRALKAALSEKPEDSATRLMLAFALIDERPSEALRQFQRLEANDETFDPVHYEQMAYLSNTLGDQTQAAQYLKRRFSQTNQPVLEHTDHYWGLRRFYGDLTQQVRLSAIASHGTGAILGDVFYDESGSVSDNLPTNNLTVRAEYFFGSLNSGTTAYAQLSGNGSNDDIFANVSQEVGLTYRPFDKINLRVSTGFQRYVNAGFSWEGFVRVNGDALNQNEYRRDWRASEGWWERNFYYDYMYFYESDQVFGQVLFNYGYGFSMSDTMFQTMLFYGLSRYDYRRASAEFEGQHAFEELAVGLGVRFDHYFVDEPIEDRLDRLRLSLEWRVNVAGDLSEDTHGLFFIAGYEF